MIGRNQSVEALNGVIEALGQDESAGVGVRALIGSSWGFFATADPAGARHAGEQAAAIARASASVPGAAMPLADVPVTEDDYETPHEEAPFAVSAVRTGRPRGGRDGDHAGRPRGRPGPGLPLHLGHREVVRLQPGPSPSPAPGGVRRRHGRHGRGRVGDPAPLLPPVVRAVRDRRLRGDPPVGLPRPCRASRRRGGGAPLRRRVPGGHHRPDPRVDPARAPDPRVGRPRHRARPHPGLGGRLRRDLLPRPRPARHRCATAPR